jgi:hypothetical protein
MQSDQENKDKEKNREAIDKIVSKREQIHQKMQLWSNIYENEYALRLVITTAADNYDKLKDSFLATTNSNARYTHIIAESDYLEDFKDGSEYTLNHLIQRYKEALQQRPIEEYLTKDKPLASAIYPPSSNERPAHEETNVIQRRRNYQIKIISFLKCHYCNVDFDNVKERKEHELEWHV